MLEVSSGIFSGMDWWNLFHHKLISLWWNRKINGCRTDNDKCTVPTKEDNWSSKTKFVNPLLLEKITYRSGSGGQLVPISWRNLEEIVSKELQFVLKPVDFWVIWCTLFFVKADLSSHQASWFNYYNAFYAGLTLKRIKKLPTGTKCHH